MARLKIAILISGRGSNMQALIDACRTRQIAAEIVVVVANNPDSAGLARARAAGFRTATVDHRDFGDRADFDAALDRHLRDAGADLVCLAGFMRLLTPGFVDAWRERLINIHPSLLPAFPGLHTHERALAAGVRFTGCTVHFVRPATDTGPIIAQAAVPVQPTDTPSSLAARVLEAEHRLYPLAVRLIAEGRVRVEGERATIEGMAAPAATLLNPLA